MKHRKFTTNVQSPQVNSPQIDFRHPEALFDKAVDLAARHDISGIFCILHTISYEDRYPALEPFVDGLRSTPDGRRMLLALYHEFWGKLELQEVATNAVADHPELALAYLYFDLGILFDYFRGHCLSSGEAYFTRTAIYYTQKELREIAQRCHLEEAYDQLDSPWRSASAEFLDPQDSLSPQSHRLPCFTPIGAQADLFRMFSGDAADAIVTAFRGGLINAMDELDQLLDHAMLYAQWAQPLDPPPLNYFGDMAFVAEVGVAVRHAHRLTATEILPAL